MRDLTRPAHNAARVKASLSRNSNRPARSVFELIAAVVWTSACPWVCAINRPLFIIRQQCSSSARLAPFLLLPLYLLMGPKRGAGMTGRGRVRHGHGSRTPRSSRGGRRGVLSAPSSFSEEEGF